MKPNESSVYQKIKSNICGPTDRMERVENGLVDGMPDVNYCFETFEGWIEIKAPTEPKRETTGLFTSNHQVSIAQMNWMHNQHMAGGTSWLLIATERRMFMIHGGRVAALFHDINTLTANGLEDIAEWKAHVPVKDSIFWRTLRELLAQPPK